MGYGSPVKVAQLTPFIQKHVYKLSAVNHRQNKTWFSKSAELRRNHLGKATTPLLKSPGQNKIFVDTEFSHVILTTATGLVLSLSIPFIFPFYTLDYLHRYENRSYTTKLYKICLVLLIIRVSPSSLYTATLSRDICLQVCHEMMHGKTSYKGVA